MTNSGRKRSSVFGFVAMVSLSAATMVWLFWHFPLTTAVTTLAVLAAFDISARISRLLETDERAELERRVNHIAR